MPQFADVIVTASVSSDDIAVFLPLLLLLLLTMVMMMMITTMTRRHCFIFRFGCEISIYSHKHFRTKAEHSLQSRNKFC